MIMENVKFPLGEKLKDITGVAYTEFASAEMVFEQIQFHFTKHLLTFEKFDHPRLFLV
jgi:hypothetical protein